MDSRQFILSGRQCRALSFGTPKLVLVEPIDRGDLDFLQRETDCLVSGGLKDFVLVTFIVEDWNAELSPWKADPVFGKVPFGDGAAATLSFIEKDLLPHVRSLFPLVDCSRVILGGYSLAALFALWAGYESEAFGSVAAASPSVWFPGWLDFAASRTPHVGSVYLSLGDAEEKTRNRVMATVGDCIRRYYSLLESQGIRSILEWNPGNHFKDADLRTAKAFLWATVNLSGKS